MYQNWTKTHPIPPQIELSKIHRLTFHSPHRPTLPKPVLPPRCRASNGRLHRPSPPRRRAWIVLHRPISQIGTHQITGPWYIICTNSLSIFPLLFVILQLHFSPNSLSLKSRWSFSPQSRRMRSFYFHFDLLFVICHS